MEMQRNFILVFIVCCWIIYLLSSKFGDETVTNILMTEAANHILIHLSGGSDIVSLQPPSSKKSEHFLADRF